MWYVRGWQGFQSWKEGCGEGAGGVCRGGGSYRECGWLCMSSCARARRCCWFLLAAGLSLSVMAHHTFHFTHFQSQYRTTPKPCHCQSCYGLRTPEVLQKPGNGFGVCVLRVPRLQMLEKHFGGNKFRDRERQGRGQWGMECSAMSPPAPTRAFGICSLSVQLFLYL